MPCGFAAEIRIRGINPFVLVAPSLIEKLRPGWRKSLPVLVRINGQPKDPHRTNLMPAGDGSFYLYLNGTVRAAADASLGDKVRVELAYDENYRNGPRHSMPACLRRALKETPAAERNWTRLAPSRKKEVLRYLAQLKSQTAVERNVSRAVYVLSGNTGRFMARTWGNGR